MSKIKILPEILSNKIAAGEVVERPSSVVKELIENALDADGAKILVEIEKGGRSLIRVADDGTGMNRDDALLSLERYGTSKIYEEEDLFSIRTLGFRGEALPSIASVSRFCLETRDGASDAGTRIDVEGGKIMKVSEIGAPVGTMITVKHLFFNTPARRKFLKTIDTEMGHVADVVATFALGWPAVQFVLHHNGKTVKSWLPAADPMERVVDVFGKDLEGRLRRIDFDDGLISVSGWTSSPQATRGTLQKIYTYINGRFVRDRIINHALIEGYADKLMKGRFPVAVLFIHVPFERVDVNVHPTKHAVRFAEPNRVHDLIKEGVAAALKLEDLRKWPASEGLQGHRMPFVYEAASGYGRFDDSIPVKTGKTPESLSVESLHKHPYEQPDLWDRKRFSDLRVIGQLHNTYILCESEEGLILVDQHAAHERVLFERLKNRPADAVKASQNLLIPETIDLSYREANTLEKLIGKLKEIGIEIEPFGGRTFIIKSVPGILAHREIKPLIIAIVEKTIESDLTHNIHGAMDHCLVLMACHGAIRANQRLSNEQIEELLAQLDRCENPSNCPHGRPTWIHWTKTFLERSFRRIV